MVGVGRVDARRRLPRRGASTRRPAAPPRPRRAMQQEKKVEQYPWVVLYLLIKAATRQATKTRDDR